MTTALERGEGSASRPGHSLPLGKTRYPLYRRLGGPQGQSGQVRKISLPPGFDPRTVQPIASRYTTCATRPHTTEYIYLIFCHSVLYTLVFMYKFKLITQIQYACTQSFSDCFCYAVLVLAYRVLKIRLWLISGYSTNMKLYILCTFQTLNNEHIYDSFLWWPWQWQVNPAIQTLESCMKALTIENHNKNSGCKGCKKRARKSPVLM